jgi:hypothetical protein
MKTSPTISETIEVGSGVGLKVPTISPRLLIPVATVFVPPGKSGSPQEFVEVPN